jgi:hypothetical protein
MLILKPVNGVWWIVNSSYPDGAWFGYTDPDIALEVIQWFTVEKIDHEGLLRRLYFGGLTRADIALVRAINKATQHPTRVRSKQEPVVRQMIKALKPVNL